MNDQLQQALAEIIGKASSGIDAGTQFLSAQLPEVIQQLLMWKAVMSGLTCLFAMVVLIFSAWPIKRFYLWVRRLADDDEFYDHPETMFAGAGCIVLLLIGVCNISLTWLQILIAPKIYLIEYAASLAK